MSHWMGGSRTIKRRLFSIITALALALSLCPTWAFAAGEIQEAEQGGLSRVTELQEMLDGANDPIPLAGAVPYVDAAGNAQQSPENCTVLTADMAGTELPGGIIFEVGVGTVYGDVVLSGIHHIPARYSLHIPAGASLSGCTLTGGGGGEGRSYRDSGDLRQGVCGGRYGLDAERYEGVRQRVHRHLQQGRNERF